MSSFPSPIDARRSPDTQRFPDTPPAVARRGSAVLRAAGRAALRLGGWRVTGLVPSEPRFVVIVAPHTSNWDFVLGVLVMFALDLRIVWLGKDTLFRPPLGSLLRALGGRPVKRSTPDGAVRDIARALAAEPCWVFALAPEGTRRPVTTWRSGFYRVAEATGVPVLPVWLDWPRREVGLGATLMPTGAMTDDVARLQRLYEPRMARVPANYACTAKG